MGQSSTTHSALPFKATPTPSQPSHRKHAATEEEDDEEYFKSEDVEYNTNGKRKPPPPAPKAMKVCPTTKEKPSETTKKAVAAAQGSNPKQPATKPPTDLPNTPSVPATRLPRFI